MPLHTTAMVSRHELEHPDEKPPAKPLAYERVLKYNPNHDPKNGQFAAASGARQGGTAGPPTSDAFGNAFGKAGTRLTGYVTPTPKDAFLRGGPPGPKDTHFYRGPEPTVTPGRENLGGGLQTRAQIRAQYQAARGAEVQAAFNRPAYYLHPPGKHPGSMTPSGQPTKRSTFS